MDRPEYQTSQLTPVRIRGKNTRDRPHKNQKVNDDSTATEPFRPRGRPLKRLSTAVVLSSSHSTASSSVSGSTKRRRRAPKPPPEVKLSLLELLPVELLENIFLYSLNLALPLCSPRLSSALSSKHVKTELVTHAFCNCTRISEVDGTLHDIDKNDTEMVEKYKRLQSELLCLKWMTLDFYVECMDNFLIRIAASEYGSRLINYGLKESLPTMDQYHELLIHCRPGNNMCSVLPSSPIMEPHRVAYECGHHTLERELRDGKILVLYMHQPLLQLLIETVQPLSEGARSDVVPLPYDSETEFEMFRCGPIGYLPSKLLHGPWTEERCEYLELLIEAGFSVDLLHTSDIEIAEKGLEDAIKERNPRALAVLVEAVRPPGFHQVNGARIEEGGESDYDLDVYDAKDEDYVYPSGEWHVGVLPKTTHLRLAVIECDCPPVIVYHLLRADPSYMDFEDTELVGWAVEKWNQGDWRGKWLLKVLRQASMPEIWTRTQGE